MVVGFFLNCRHQMEFFLDLLSNMRHTRGVHGSGLTSSPLLVLSSSPPAFLLTSSRTIARLFSYSAPLFSSILLLSSSPANLSYSSYLAYSHLPSHLPTLPPTSHLLPDSLFLVLVVSKRLSTLISVISLVKPNFFVH